MSQQSKKDRRETENELAEAKKKEIKELVLSFTTGVGEVTPRPIDPNDAANRSPGNIHIDHGVDDDRDDNEGAEIVTRVGLTCPKCGCRVENDYRSCPGCAAKLKQECPGCHEFLPMSFKSCPKCGTRFSKLWDPMADVRDD